MTLPFYDLRERVILITGSTGHLGRAMSWGLAQAGARVILVSRSVEKITAQAAQLTAENYMADAMPFDINDGPRRRALLSDISKKYGRLDGVVNNAYSPPTGKGADAFLEAYKISVAAAAELVTDALELLENAGRQNRGGASIVNVASMYGIVSPNLKIYSDLTPPNPPFYGPAKAGLLQLTRYLACELGPRNIRVNAISPGPFPAPSVEKNDPEFVKRLETRNPLGRIGHPEELIGPLLFLLSDASSFVTGANLCVDGGWTAW